MCRYAKCTDEELIARLRSGEAEISDYLMEKYKGFVRKKARTMFDTGGNDRTFQGCPELSAR